MEEQSSPECVCPLGYDKCTVLGDFLKLHSECEHLLHLSITDPLTELFNYRHLVSSLDQEMERTRRTGLPTGLIMIDLDYFKRVNDSYGHYAGDQALRWASRIWKENTRRIDVPCRYGGEEFAIVLPATQLPQAVMLAERLRERLADSPMPLDGISIPLTASFGVISYKGQKMSSVERLFDCADQLLFRAKMLGRNRVCSESGSVRKPCTEVTAEERAVLYNSGGETTGE